MILLLTAIGCNGGSNYGYAGYDMVDHFPLDGDRTWYYSNGAYPYTMEVELVGETEQVGDYQVHTLEYYSEANGNLLWSLRVSSDTIRGIGIHGYTIVSEEGGGEDTGGADSGEAGGPEEMMTFDPPVLLAEDQMVPGASVTSETGGYSWTSTFHRQEDCPNDWVSGENTWKCLYIQLDDGDGDETTGPRIAGSYWLAPRFGMSWFQLTGDAAKWLLGRMDWEASR